MTSPQGWGQGCQGGWRWVGILRVEGSNYLPAGVKRGQSRDHQKQYRCLPAEWWVCPSFFSPSSLGLPFRTFTGMVARMTSQQGRSQSSRKNILREQRVRQCTQGSPVSGWFPLFLGWQHQSVIVQGWGSSDGNGGELKSTFAQRC